MGPVGIECALVRLALPAGMLTFTHADGAALLVLAVAVAAVLVAGEGRTLDAATHLTAMFVPPEGGQRIYAGIKTGIGARKG